MISFRIHLQRAQRRSPWDSSGLTAEAEAAPVAGLLERLEHDRRQKRLQRDFRSYLADPHCMPAPPVLIRLLRTLEPEIKAPVVKGEYELELVDLAPPQPAPRNGLGSSLARIAAAAAVVLAPGRMAHGALGGERAGAALPPSLPAHDASRTDGSLGPPVTRLKGHELRSEAGAASPVVGENGRPVRVAAFHSNTPLTPHTNNALVHSNTWGNHANIQTVHSNVWQNHSNTAASGTTPHTNIVPGDFVF